MFSRTLAAALALSFPLSASAQDSWSYGEELDPMLYENTFAVGAGALGFMEAGLEFLPAALPHWTIRYGWSPDPSWTWEWIYSGSTDAFMSPDLAFVATIYETGFKLNLGPGAPAYPIVGAGVGYMAFQGRASETDLAMMTIPVIVGFEVVAEELVVDVRGTWRPTMFDDEVRMTSLGADSWALTMDLGTRF